MARPSRTKTKPALSRRNPTYFERIESDVKSNQSTLSMVLGALIVLVVGVLVFNYFTRNQAEVGPAQQTTQLEQAGGDVAPGNLPGKYTVKEGDTLFAIAQKYYSDGYKFDQIAQANSLSDVNTLEVGKVLEIPKLDGQQAAAGQTPAPQATQAPETVTTPVPQAAVTPVPQASEAPAIGGGNTTIWGPKIEGSTYTVVAGDWLSTISARAYGDIYAYQKLAQANNIANPDLIEPGMVLKIPR